MIFKKIVNMTMLITLCYQFVTGYVYAGLENEASNTTHFYSVGFGVGRACITNCFDLIRQRSITALNTLPFFYEKVIETENYYHNLCKNAGVVLPDELLDKSRIDKNAINTENIMCETLQKIDKKLQEYVRFYCMHTICSHWEKKLKIPNMSCNIRDIEQKEMILSLYANSQTAFQDITGNNKDLTWLSELNTAAFDHHSSVYVRKKSTIFLEIFDSMMMLDSEASNRKDYCCVYKGVKVEQNIKTCTSSAYHPVNHITPCLPLCKSIRNTWVALYKYYLKHIIHAIYIRTLVSKTEEEYLYFLSALTNYMANNEISPEINRFRLPLQPLLTLLKKSKPTIEDSIKIEVGSDNTTDLQDYTSENATACEKRWYAFIDKNNTQSYLKKCKGDSEENHESFISIMECTPLLTELKATYKHKVSKEPEENADNTKVLIYVLETLLNKISSEIYIFQVNSYDVIVSKKNELITLFSIDYDNLVFSTNSVKLLRKILTSTLSGMTEQLYDKMMRSEEMRPWSSLNFIKLYKIEYDSASGASAEAGNQVGHET